LNPADVAALPAKEARSMTGERNYNSIPIPKSVEERPTEDDLARASLGGVKGNEKLPPARLTKQEEEQTLPNDEPGHVA
jgi:hypothetical protein